jgi:hypothetical protein
MKSKAQAECQENFPMPNLLNPQQAKSHIKLSTMRMKKSLIVSYLIFSNCFSNIILFLKDPSQKERNEENISFPIPIFQFLYVVYDFYIPSSFFLCSFIKKKNITFLIQFISLFSGFFYKSLRFPIERFLYCQFRNNVSSSIQFPRIVEPI